MINNILRVKFIFILRYLFRKKRETENYLNLYSTKTKLAHKQLIPLLFPHFQISCFLVVR